MVKTRISPKPTLIVDWIKRLSMLAGDITPLFMVSPFSTSGIPDFQRTTIQKTPRGSCAHPPWSLRSSPKSSASPRDQIPEGETEKLRNHLHRRSCNIPRTKHKECTEEYSDRWRNAFACTCSSNQKEKDFHMLLGNLQKLQFHPRFCYPATSQTGLFFLANPIFSGWKHSSATHQTSVLVLQRQDLLLIESCSIHLSAWVPWA